MLEGIEGDRHGRHGCRWWSRPYLTARSSGGGTDTGEVLARLRAPFELRLVSHGPYPDHFRIAT